MCEQPQQRFSCNHCRASQPLQYCPTAQASPLNPNETDLSKREYRSCGTITYPTHFLSMNCPECAPKAEEKRLEELRKALKSDADVKAGVVEHPDYFVAKSEGEKREWKKEQEGKNWYGNYEAKSERETREWKKNEEKNWFGNYEAKGDRETREWKKKKEEENWFDK